MHLHSKAINQQPYLRRSHNHNSSVSIKNNTPIITRVSRSSSETGGIQNSKFQSNSESSSTNITDANKNQQQSLIEENKTNSELLRPIHSSFSSFKSSFSTSTSLTQQDNPSRNQQSQHKISARLSTSHRKELTVKPPQSNHHDMKEFFRAIKFNVLTKKKSNCEVMPQLQPQSNLKYTPYYLGNNQTMQQQHLNSIQDLQLIKNDTQISQKTSSSEGNLYPNLSHRLNQKQQININLPKTAINQDKPAITTGFYMPQASFSRSLVQTNEDKSEQLSQRLDMQNVQHKRTKQQIIDDRIRKVMNFSLTKELNDFVYQLQKPDKSVSKSSILKFPSLTPKLSPKPSLHAAAAQEEYFGNNRVSAKFNTKSDSSNSSQNPFLEEKLFNSLSSSSSSLASKKKQVHFILEDSLFDSNKKTINKNLA